MKFKRILSMLLAVIMLSTALIAAFPTFAFAANSAPSTEYDIQPNMYLHKDADGQIKEESFTDYSEFVKQLNKYTSSQEMLQTELEAGQLMHTTSQNGLYTIYVNVYTGFMYYQNNVTGQILMSNYYNYSNVNPTPNHLSQIEIEYAPIVSDSSDPLTMNSYDSAAAFGQIEVTKLSNGLRVNYTIGDTTLRYLVPGAISQERYMSLLAEPIMSLYLSEVISAFNANEALKKAVYGGVLRENGSYSSTANGDAEDFFYNCLNAHWFDLAGPGDSNRKFFDALGSDNQVAVFAAAVMGYDFNTQKKEFSNSGDLDKFYGVIKSLYHLINIDTEGYFCNAHKVAGVKNRQTGEYTCPECGTVLGAQPYKNFLFYDREGKLNMDVLKLYLSLVNNLITNKTLLDGDSISVPSFQKIYIPLTRLVETYNNKNTPYLLTSLDSTDYNDLKAVQKLILTYCFKNYTFNDLYRDEKEWGYVYNYSAQAVFRCALEYTFNEDGTLSISLPANSISFDESSFILHSITPLKFFGTGTLKDPKNNSQAADGYVFYPDGCGTVVDFTNYEGRPIHHAPIYGIDYAYSDIEDITGDYREQVTMPVYGIVYTEYMNDVRYQNGFFAIIEEGAALADLNFEFDIPNLAMAYARYKPYPSDTYDLSRTLSVAGMPEYTMVSESKYSGSYVTRIAMLSDEKLGTQYGNLNYEASYVGMAAYYRDYLKSTGVINAIADIGNDLPLYIEAFGSMEVIKKILSFPVEVSTPLTTFDDIRTMYDQLADAKNVIHNKALEYRQKADAENKDLALKELYESKCNEYLALEQSIQNITNINFRLTGFANGGMEYTYPSKIKWDKAVGGKKGFESLLDYSKTVSAKDGANLGIYPEFDFLYVSNTSFFDGISPKKMTSKLIDNRYAVKQLYNSITHSYEEMISSVVSPDALAELYVKFNKDFSELNIKNISVSTLGSDVNSNFDDEDPINRHQAVEYIAGVLGSMSDDGYEIMLNRGNSYSLEYASHIIDAYVDSSHLRAASYTVPFFGMVLHGYVNYTGNALNYSGDPSYDILRSIENGASIYYILCYQNTEQMKENLALNKYYGVSYTNWFDSVVAQYAKINEAIGGLQAYEIVSHKILKAERLMDERERKAAYANLVSEFIAAIDSQIEQLVKIKFNEMKANGVYDKDIRVEIDTDAIVEYAVEILELNNSIKIPASYANEVKENVRAYVAALEREYNEIRYPSSYDESDEDKFEVITYNSVAAYKSQYDYFTDSLATDGKAYDATDYTVENYNVVMVTYRDARTGHEVSFVLNYNIYDVIVDFGNGNTFKLGKYDFKTLK